MVVTTLRTIGFDEALGHVDRGAVFVDLRDVPPYLDVHIPGSLALVYEFGPGMAARARDCIPLSLPFLLLVSENANMLHAAASLRGKGFDVIGQVEGALNQWAARRGQLASTELTESTTPTSGKVIDVADPARRRFDGATDVPIERLWGHLDDLRGDGTITVLTGRGVRAALAIGMLERVGLEVRLWRYAGSPDA